MVFLPCSAIMCPVPRQIANGGYNISGLTVGSGVSFHCSRGYQLSGAPNAVCQANMELVGRSTTLSKWGHFHSCVFFLLFTAIYIHSCHTYSIVNNCSFFANTFCIFFWGLNHGRLLRCQVLCQTLEGDPLSTYDSCPSLVLDFRRSISLGPRWWQE